MRPRFQTCIKIKRWEQSYLKIWGFPWVCIHFYLFVWKINRWGNTWKLRRKCLRRRFLKSAWFHRPGGRGSPLFTFFLLFKSSGSVESSVSWTLICSSSTFMVTRALVCSLWFHTISRPTHPVVVYKIWAVGTGRGGGCRLLGALQQIICVTLQLCWCVTYSCVLLCSPVLHLC